jgi:hypothetical protein
MHRSKPQIQTGINIPSNKRVASHIYTPYQLTTTERLGSKTKKSIT